jgi:hypothetical protein
MPNEIEIYLNSIPQLIQVIFSAEFQQHYLPILLVMLQLVIGIIKWNNRIVKLFQLKAN